MNFAHILKILIKNGEGTRLSNPPPPLDAKKRWALQTTFVCTLRSIEENLANDHPYPTYKRIFYLISRANTSTSYTYLGLLLRLVNLVAKFALDSANNLLFVNQKINEYLIQYLFSGVGNTLESNRFFSADAWSGLKSSNPMKVHQRFIKLSVKCDNHAAEW